MGGCPFPKTKTVPPWTRLIALGIDAACVAVVVAGAYELLWHVHEAIRKLGFPTFYYGSVLFLALRDAGGGFLSPGKMLLRYAVVDGDDEPCSTVKALARNAAPFGVMGTFFPFWVYVGEAMPARMGMAVVFVVPALFVLLVLGLLVTDAVRVLHAGRERLGDRLAGTRVRAGRATFDGRRGLATIGLWLALTFAALVAHEGPPSRAWIGSRVARPAESPSGGGGLWGPR